MSAALRRLEDEIERHRKELNFTVGSRILCQDRLELLTRNEEAIQKILFTLRDLRAREIERDARDW